MVLNYILVGCPWFQLKAHSALRVIVVHDGLTICKTDIIVEALRKASKSPFFTRKPSYGGFVCHPKLEICGWNHGVTMKHLPEFFACRAEPDDYSNTDTSNSPLTHLELSSTPLDFTPLFSHLSVNSSSDNSYFPLTRTKFLFPWSISHWNLPR